MGTMVKVSPLAKMIPLCLHLGRECTHPIYSFCSGILSRKGKRRASSLPQQCIPSFCCAWRVVQPLITYPSVSHLALARFLDSGEQFMEILRWHLSPQLGSSPGKSRKSFATDFPIDPVLNSSQFPVGVILLRFFLGGRGGWIKTGPLNGHNSNCGKSTTSRA